MTIIQADRDAWEIYGPMIFHCEITGPEVVALIREAAEARAKLEGAKAMPDDLTYALRSALRFAGSRSAITSAQEQAILAALDTDTIAKDETNG